MGGRGGSEGEEGKVKKEEESGVNMGGFMKRERVRVVEKVDGVDGEEEGAMWEGVEEVGEEVEKRMEIGFEGESERGR